MLYKTQIIEADTLSCSNISEKLSPYLLQCAIEDDRKIINFRLEQKNLYMALNDFKLMYLALVKYKEKYDEVLYMDYQIKNILSHILTICTYLNERGDAQDDIPFYQIKFNDIKEQGEHAARVLAQQGIHIHGDNIGITLKNIGLVQNTHLYDTPPATERQDRALPTSSSMVSSSQSAPASLAEMAKDPDEPCSRFLDETFYPPPTFFDDYFNALYHSIKDSHIVHRHFEVARPSGFGKRNIHRYLGHVLKCHACLQRTPIADKLSVEKINVIFLDFQNLGKFNKNNEIVDCLIKLLENAYNHLLGDGLHDSLRNDCENFKKNGELRKIIPHIAKHMDPLVVLVHHYDLPLISYVLSLDLPVSSTNIESDPSLFILTEILGDIKNCQKIKLSIFTSVVPYIANGYADSGVLQILNRNSRTNYSLPSIGYDTAQIIRLLGNKEQQNKPLTSSPSATLNYEILEEWHGGYYIGFRQEFVSDAVNKSLDSGSLRNEFGRSLLEDIGLSKYIFGLIRILGEEENQVKHSMISLLTVGYVSIPQINGIKNLTPKDSSEAILIIWSFLYDAGYITILPDVMSDVVNISCTVIIPNRQAFENFIAQVIPILGNTARSLTTSSSYQNRAKITQDFYDQKYAGPQIFISFLENINSSPFFGGMDSDMKDHMLNAFKKACYILSFLSPCKISFDLLKYILGDTIKTQDFINFFRFIYIETIDWQSGYFKLKEKVCNALIEHLQINSQLLDEVRDTTLSLFSSDLDINNTSQIYYCNKDERLNLLSNIYEKLSHIFPENQLYHVIKYLIYIKYDAIRTKTANEKFNTAMFEDNNGRKFLADELSTNYCMSFMSTQNTKNYFTKVYNCISTLRHRQQFIFECIEGLWENGFIYDAIKLAQKETINANNDGNLFIFLLSSVAQFMDIMTPFNATTPQFMTVLDNHNLSNVTMVSTIIKFIDDKYSVCAEKNDYLYYKLRFMAIDFLIEFYEVDDYVLAKEIIEQYMHYVESNFRASSELRLIKIRLTRSYLFFYEYDDLKALVKDINGIESAQDDRHPSTSLIQIYSIVGFYLFTIGDLSHAVEYYKKSIACYKEVGHKKNNFYWYMKLSLATCYFQLGNFNRTKKIINSFKNRVKSNDCSSSYEDTLNSSLDITEMRGKFCDANIVYYKLLMQYYWELALPALAEDALKQYKAYLTTNTFRRTYFEQQLFSVYQLQVDFYVGKRSLLYFPPKRYHDILDRLYTQFPHKVYEIYTCISRLGVIYLMLNNPKAACELFLIINRNDIIIYPGLSQFKNFLMFSNLLLLQTIAYLRRGGFEQAENCITQSGGILISTNFLKEQYPRSNAYSTVDTLKWLLDLANNRYNADTGNANAAPTLLFGYTVALYAYHHILIFIRSLDDNSYSGFINELDNLILSVVQRYRVDTHSFGYGNTHFPITRIRALVLYGNFLHLINRPNATQQLLEARDGLVLNGGFPRLLSDVYLTLMRIDPLNKSKYLEEFEATIISQQNINALIATMMDIGIYGTHKLSELSSIFINLLQTTSVANNNTSSSSNSETQVTSNNTKKNLFDDDLRSALKRVIATVNSRIKKAKTTNNLTHKISLLVDLISAYYLLKDYNNAFQCLSKYEKAVKNFQTLHKVNNDIVICIEIKTLFFEFPNCNIDKTINYLRNFKFELEKTPYLAEQAYGILHNLASLLAVDGAIKNALRIRPSSIAIGKTTEAMEIFGHLSTQSFRALVELMNIYLHQSREADFIRTYNSNIEQAMVGDKNIVDLIFGELEIFIVPHFIKLAIVESGKSFVISPYVFFFYLSMCAYATWPNDFENHPIKREEIIKGFYLKIKDNISKNDAAWYLFLSALMDTNSLDLYKAGFDKIKNEHYKRILIRYAPSIFAPPTIETTYLRSRSTSTPPVLHKQPNGIASSSARANLSKPRSISPAKNSSNSEITESDIAAFLFYIKDFLCKEMMALIENKSFLSFNWFYEIIPNDASNTMEIILTPEISPILHLDHLALHLGLTLAKCFSPHILKFNLPLNLFILKTRTGALTISASVGIISIFEYILNSISHNLIMKAPSAARKLAISISPHKYYKILSKLLNTYQGSNKEDATRIQEKLIKLPSIDGRNNTLDDNDIRQLINIFGQIMRANTTSIDEIEPTSPFSSSCTTPISDTSSSTLSNLGSQPLSSVESWRTNSTNSYGSSTPHEGRASSESLPGVNTPMRTVFSPTVRQLDFFNAPMMRPHTVQGQVSPLREPEKFRGGSSLWGALPNSPRSPRSPRSPQRPHSDNLSRHLSKQP